MTTTIDIPDDILRRAMQAAAARSPQEAVVRALVEFTDRHGQAQLIGHLGTFDDIMTLSELEQMRKDYMF